MTSGPLQRLLLCGFFLAAFAPGAIANAPMCKAGEITVKAPGKSTTVQCLKCLECPGGTGLSVNCGDTITPDTAVMCKKCVLGETFSSNATGTCEQCRECSEMNKVTMKNCTLTSNSVCGGCKPDSYVDSLTGQCELCSYCCSDDRDEKQNECIQQGMPANKACRVIRADFCRKKVLQKMKADNTTTAGPTGETGTSGSSGTNPPQKQSETRPTVGVTVSSTRSASTITSVADTESTVAVAPKATPAVPTAPETGGGHIPTAGVVALSGVLGLAVVGIVLRVKAKRRPSGGRTRQADMETGPDGSGTPLVIGTGGPNAQDSEPAQEENAEESLRLSTENTEQHGKSLEKSK